MKKDAKSWQSRLGQDQDAQAVAFVESISVDRRLYKYDIVGSIAHAQMLSEVGLLSRDEFRQIKEALTQIAEQIDADGFTFDPRYEDIHMVLEAALVQKTGPAGQKLHTGRSRNDQVVLDMRLWMRDTIATTVERLMALQESLVKMAAKQGQTLIPGYTHLQRAQPVLVGHYLLAFVEQFQRDRQRFEDAQRRVNVCPLGAGALAGSTLPLDRARVAQLLGFADVARNSIDAVSDRDFCAEFLFCCAMAGMHLSRLAEDWIIFNSQEFGFIAIDDAYCTSSSMMPQKRNPDMLELIRGKTGRLYGQLVTMLTILKAQPLTYNRDLQEDKTPVFDAADTLAACLDMAGALVRHSAFQADHIQKNIDAGYLDATALAEYLVTKGLPFRQAHQTVGKLVQQAEQQGLPLAQLPIETLQAACDKITPDVYDHLTPAHVVQRYATAGAAGARQLDEQLTFWREMLKGTA